MAATPVADSSFRQDVEEALRYLNGDWPVAVLVALSLGRLHFVEVQRSVNDIERRYGRRRHRVELSTKVLSTTLDHLDTSSPATSRYPPSPTPSPLNW